MNPVLEMRSFPTKFLQTDSTHFPDVDNLCRRSNDGVIPREFPNSLDV